MSAPLLQISALQVFYGQTQALFDASLLVRSGEFVSLLGRNGMGKSTLIKATMGLMPIASGRVTFAGEELAGLPSYLIAQKGIGLVPEGRRIIATLTVEENLAAFARKDAGDQRASWSIDKTYDMFPRLKDRRRALGRTLSGGEQQMLAIGRALITKPRLLILDEATEGLAPLVCEEIWACLRALKADGLAILVVDKNLKPLLDLSQRHFILEKGRTVWDGSSDDYRAQSETLHRYLTI